jgi:hypothetical protein
MRFRHADGSTIHLAYCSNVHPAEDLDGVIDQLGRFAGPVRAELDASRLGVGLWLSAPVAAGLAGSPSEVKRLRAALDQHQLEVVTGNGFPYRGFHEPVVKHAVYRPDWSEPERADYTLDVARVLAELLPDDVDEGSISTLPLAWRTPWDSGRDDRARSGLLRVADGLATLEDESGRQIRLGLEPEPGCILSTVQAMSLYLRDLDTPWVGVCLDACHLAVDFEDPFEAIWRDLVPWRIPVVKSQLSSGRRSYAPGRERDDLARLVEPRFLHQTRARSIPHAIGACDDLDEALAGHLNDEAEWRIHFHVPVHHGPGTTQPELLLTMGQLVGGPVPVTRHLEVETYTWSVLPDPPTDDAGLVAGLAAELAWTRDRLTALGLEEIP